MCVYVYVCVYIYIPSLPKKQISIKKMWLVGQYMPQHQLPPDNISPGVYFGWEENKS